MKKYKVYGTTVVTVTKEVWANNEDEAYQKAFEKLDCLTSFCGNGGIDKLVGVYGDDESVDADGSIEYDDIEELEDDPSYFECPNCGDECENAEGSDGVWYWRCGCGACWDNDGYEYEEEE